MVELKLRQLALQLSICKLASGDVPEAVLASKFLSITKTHAEHSIVCESNFVPVGINCEKDYCAFEVLGPLDFSLIGVLAKLTGLLAEADIPVFVISTFDTDYILVKEYYVEQAASIFCKNGLLSDV